MPSINILSPHVADLIAAGEVVERPGAAVKELIENAIDAGAKNITVEISAGGAVMLRVRDDGCGMAPEDAGIAFLRHATSKLKDAGGLEAIGTLGFRGEALAAISAVSRIEMLTRERGQASGTRLVLEAGEIQSLEEAGCPEGTVITVRDLFFNTPARLKFLKSDRAEGAYCVAQALRCALGRPDISIRCIRDGQEQFFSPGDGKIESCVYSLLGRELAVGMLPCRSADGTVSVEGYISAPHSCRGSRSSQFFFVNGRSIKSLTLQAALEQAYKNTLLTGRFPACALYITLSYGAVDVNVHPTKNEVKFSHEKQVFDGIYYAVKAALDMPGHAAGLQLDNPEPQKQTPAPPTAIAANQAPAVPVRADFAASRVSSEIRPRQETDLSKLFNREPDNVCADPALLRTPMPCSEKPAWMAPDPAGAIPAPRAADETKEAGYKETDSVLQQPLPEAFEQVVFPESAPVPPEESVRVIGEALNTYIVAECGDAMLLIDKHAAHERMIFDRLMNEPGEMMSQQLLMPLTFSPGAENTEKLLENLALLRELGFEVEAYGQGSVIIRAVPADLRGSEISTLEEICEKLGGSRAGLNTRDEILHTVACKAAIKAGNRSDPAELQAIAVRVASGEIRYCPHGRPVSVRLTKKELDKQFKRIV